MFLLFHKFERFYCHSTTNWQAGPELFHNYENDQNCENDQNSEGDQNYESDNKYDSDQNDKSDQN